MQQVDNQNIQSAIGCLSGHKASLGGQSPTAQTGPAWSVSEESDEKFIADEKSIKRYLDLRRIAYRNKLAKEELFIIIEPNQPPKLTRGRLKKWLTSYFPDDYTHVGLSAMHPKYNFWIYFNSTQDQECNDLGTKLFNKLRSAYEEFTEQITGTVIISMQTCEENTLGKTECGISKSVWKDIQKFVRYRPFCFRDKQAAINEITEK